MGHNLEQASKRNISNRHSYNLVHLALDLIVILIKLLLISDKKYLIIVDNIP